MRPEEEQGGEAFGRFILLKRVAVGGMAEVYLAKLPGVAGFEKHVVIKKVLPSLSRDPEFVQRLIHEGKLVSRLNHGNIVQVLELGEEAGELYLAMEYVDGRDLHACLAEARQRGIRFPQPIVVHVLLQVAQALACAHTTEGGDGRPLGVIHRDVSPGNVLISREGQVKLTDFGIARASGLESEARTAQGLLRGKVPYMPPEQVRGEELGPESDVFSFGVLAYELLTGQRPFDADNDVLTLERIRSGSFTPLLELRPDLDPDLCTVVESCLARERENRPSDGVAIGQALARLMADRNWVVGAADVAELMDTLFPRGAGGDRIEPGERLPPGTGTGSGRVQTRSLATPASGHRPWMWVVMILILLMAVGAVGFGLGILMDYDKRDLRVQPLPASDVRVQPVAEQRQDVVRRPEIRTQPAPVPDVVAATSKSDITTEKPDLKPEVGQRAETRESPTDVREPAPEVVASEVVAAPTEPDVKERKAPTPDRPRRRPSLTTLTVQPPAAVIEVKGRKLTGRAEIRLSPGERVTIKLSHPKHADETFDLIWPGPRKLFKKLARLETGSLKVRYLPASAHLFLDGRKVNPSSGLNIVVLEVTAGWHQLRLEDDAGRRRQKRVEVKPGEQTGITLQLE